MTYDTKQRCQRKIIKEQESLNIYFGGKFKKFVAGIIDILKKIVTCNINGGGVGYR